jgi:hypothetical protein
MPILRTTGLEFLQLFINELMKAGQARLLILPQTFLAPYNVLAIEPFFLTPDSSEDDQQALTLFPLDYAMDGTMDFSKVIGDGPESEIVRATWAAVFKHGHGSGQIVLSSCSVDHCKLGDLLVFILAELPLFMEGRLLGLCTLLLGQFGEWLDKAIIHLAPPSHKAIDIPQLRGLIRARNLDSMQLGHLAAVMAEGQLSNQSQSGKQFGHMKHESKLMVYLYTMSLAKKLATAPSRSLHILADGWRSIGEQMDLFFAYSPWLNIGGWWPFQVPLFLVQAI